MAERLVQIHVIGPNEYLRALLDEIWRIADRKQGESRDDMPNYNAYGHIKRLVRQAIQASVKE